MNLIIIGPRSAGKSSTGRLLAKKLRYKYIEFDKIVEKNLKDIDKYCKRHGVDSYRKEERKILIQLLNKLHKDFVMCIGGGTVASQLKGISSQNAKSLKKYGKLIYLNPSNSNHKAIELLLKREKFREGNQSREHTKNLFKIRKPIYNKIKDFEIIVDEKSTNEIVKEILKLIQKNK